MHVIIWIPRPSPPPAEGNLDREALGLPCITGCSTIHLGHLLCALSWKATVQTDDNWMGGMYM